MTLPSDWIKKNYVKKGDEIDLEIRDEEIVLRKEEKKPEALEVDINLSGLDRTTILHIIRNLYRAGYDKINITFDEQKAPYQKLGESILVTQIIHDQIKMLLGYEITRERKNSCIIENISEGITEEIPTVIRRIYLLMIDIVETLLESAENNDKTNLITINQKHETIIRFINYCLRSSVKMPYRESQIGKKDIFRLGTMDRIIHILHSIAKRLVKLQNKPSKTLVEVLRKTDESLKIFHKFIYTNKSLLITELNLIRYDVEEIIRLSSNKLEVEQNIALLHCRHILHLLLDICDVKGL